MILKIKIDYLENETTGYQFIEQDNFIINKTTEMKPYGDMNITSGIIPTYPVNTYHFRIGDIPFEFKEGYLMNNDGKTIEKFCWNNKITLLN